MLWPRPLVPGGGDNGTAAEYGRRTCYGQKGIAMAYAVAGPYAEVLPLGEGVGER